MRRYEKEPDYSTILSILGGIFYFLVWWPFISILLFLKRLIQDIFTDVYGRLVKYLGYIGFLVLVAVLVSLLKF